MRLFSDLLLSSKTVCKILILSSTVSQNDRLKYHFKMNVDQEKKNMNNAVIYPRFVGIEKEEVLTNSRLLLETLNPDIVLNFGTSASTKNILDKDLVIGSTCTFQTPVKKGNKIVDSIDTDYSLSAIAFSTKRYKTVHMIPISECLEKNMCESEVATSIALMADIYNKPYVTLRHITNENEEYEETDQLYEIVHDVCDTVGCMF